VNGYSSISLAKLNISMFVSIFRFISGIPVQVSWHRG